MGLCCNLFRYSNLPQEWFQDRFEKWDLFSGNITFPIPFDEVPEEFTEEEMADEGYYLAQSSGGLYDRATVYGQNRYKLAAYIIECLKEEL